MSWTGRLFVVTAAQRVTAKETEQAAQKMRLLAAEIAPGFHVLADFRFLESMEAGTERHIAEIMDVLSQKKVAAVARVISDPHKDIGLNILSHFHYGPGTFSLTSVLSDSLLAVKSA